MQCVFFFTFNFESENIRRNAMELIVVLFIDFEIVDFIFAIFQKIGGYL